MDSSLTDLHMLVLGWIGEQPAAGPHDVALAFGLDEATAKRLLDDLAAAEFIESMMEQ